MYAVVVGFRRTSALTPGHVHTSHATQSPSAPSASQRTTRQRGVLRRRAVTPSARRDVERRLWEVEAQEPAVLRPPVGVRVVDGGESAVGPAREGVAMAPVAGPAPGVAGELQL